MDAAAREELISRIEAQPERFVAQEQVALSTVPVYTESGGLETRHVVLRVFAAWDGNSYTVLPGGLTRVSREGPVAGDFPARRRRDQGHLGARWLGRAGCRVAHGAGADCGPSELVESSQQGCRQPLLAGPLCRAPGGPGATGTGPAAGALRRRGFWPHRHAGVGGPPADRAEVSAAGGRPRLAGRTTMAGAAAAGQNGSR